MTASATNRVAVVQAAPVVFDLAATLARVRELATQAAAGGAKLILFPEAFVSGYPRGISFGTVLGNRTASGRDHYRRYWESSVDVPGPAVDEMASLAAELALHMVIGVIERDRGTLYCTALFFSPGGYLGKHRKVMPTAAERLVWGFGDGSTLPVFDTPLGRVGAVICWENYMPLLRMAMYSKGIQIYCMPTADGRETWLSTVRHIALEGRCFVLSANQFTRLSDFPEDIENELASRPGDVVCLGGSCIVGPSGDVLAGPDFKGEKILFADIDLDEIARGKFDLDVTGHYARPDLFQLEVNEAPQKPVVYVIREDGQPAVESVDVRSSHEEAGNHLIGRNQMATVADGIKTQLSNIEKTYGHSIDDLTAEIAGSGLIKHTEVVAMLKQRYGMTHGAAHRVSLTARDRLGQPSASAKKSISQGTEEIYSRLLAAAASLGPDVEQAPKKGYVSLRRRKQFAMLQPAAKWVDVGLVLPAANATGRLEPAARWNALFTHRVRVHAEAEIDGELRSWLATAYDAAG